MAYVAPPEDFKREPTPQDYKDAEDEIVDRLEAVLDAYSRLKTRQTGRCWDGYRGLALFRILDRLPNETVDKALEVLAQMRSLQRPG